ncbi:MAG: hypothetical protein ACQJCO_06330 [cyanobacterium endosymbiont of Rhopalodia sterrenbergii]
MSADYLIPCTLPALIDLTTSIETVHTMVVPLKTTHRFMLTKVDYRSFKEILGAQNILLKLKIPTFHTFMRQYKAHKRVVLEGVPITE